MEIISDGIKKVLGGGGNKKIQLQATFRGHNTMTKVIRSSTTIHTHNMIIIPTQSFRLVKQPLTKPLQPSTIHKLKLLISNLQGRKPSPSASEPSPISSIFRGCTVTLYGERTPPTLPPSVQY